MRLLALLILLVSGCATTGAKTSGPREIAGWPEWLCLDFPGTPNLSYWYPKTQTAKEGRTYDGSCDSWANGGNIGGGHRPPVVRFPPPVEGHPPEDYRSLPQPKPVDLKLLKSFEAASTWPGWLCADFKDGRPESVWRSTSEAAPPDTVYPGRCEDWGEQTGGVRTGSRSPSFKILGGKGRATLLLENQALELTMTLLELDPGAAVTEHDHESAEYLYLLQGAVEMTLNGKKKSANSGDAIHIPAGIKHSAKVVGDVRVKAVQIYAPPGPEQRFRKGEKIR